MPTPTPKTINDVALCLPDPLDEGFGHSFLYVPPHAATAHRTAAEAFRTISGASISANTWTPLSTDPFAYSAALDKAASFESSNLFSSIPLQPIPRNSTEIKSGPILRNPILGSGPIDRGFLSGPIERSFISGPLDSHKPKSRKREFVRNFKRAIHNSLWTFSKHLNGINEHQNNATTGSTNSGNSSTITSHNMSSELSLVDENDDVRNELFDRPNVQWAQGKAGEDRVHIVISEDDGWVFVRIYDGFNGPDATDYLLHNLYANVQKELKGLLWSDNVQTAPDSSKSLDYTERMDLDRKLREKMMSNLGPDGVADKKVKTNATVNHLVVLKALKNTEALYLETSNTMLLENPELALMGSCVLVMMMKGDDLYLMNVGDSRGVLARNADDSQLEKNRKGNEENRSTVMNTKTWVVCVLVSSQWSTAHPSKSEKGSKRSHQDDAFTIINSRVKGSLKVTRAFGAGFLKHPKWNNALLEMFRIDYIGTSPYIVFSPSLCHHRLQPNDKFLILSSDGLYQYFTNEEAVFEFGMFVSTFPQGDPAQHLFEQLLFRAANTAGLEFHELLAIPQGARRRYHDDVFIVIISLEGKMWRSSV